MRLIACVLMLSLAGPAIAAAQAADRKMPRVYWPSIVIMRALVPADALAGYGAFNLTVTRPGDPSWWWSAREHEYFGASEGKVAYDEALNRWTPLAREGDPEAMSNLGVLYDLGLGVAQDPDRAVRLYREGAERDFSPAQNNLGIAYALGRGVARDDAQALHWLRKAAANGLALAANTLGVMSLRGRGTARDERSGLAWLARARGFEVANRNLALVYDTKVAEPGFDEYFWDAVSSAMGWPAVPEDPLEAYVWFDRATDLGFPAAQRRRALAEAAGRASTERWGLSFSSAPEHELREESELIAKIDSALCRSYTNSNFVRVRKILRNTSKRVLGREMRLEQAYRLLRCYTPEAENIDLIRVTAEKPMLSREAAQELVDYFVHEAKDRFLLGRILMCKRDFGYGCLDVFGHIEKNLKEAQRRGRRYEAEALNDFKRLLHHNLDEEHLQHDPPYCRAFFEEPELCGN